MNYCDRLTDAFSRTGSLVCVGLDPQIERIPVDEPNEQEKIVRFCTRIIDGINSQGIANTVKPNYAFFAQYGFPGLRALKEVIEVAQNNNLIVILDAKRGDIGKTAEAYAKEAFDFWEADAVTVSGYMGRDTIEPYLEYSKHGKGVYVLAKTSNLGSKDIEDLNADGKKVYEHIAQIATNPLVEGTGLVVGATFPKEMQSISSICYGKRVPFLIPGVGSQGGSISAVLGVLDAKTIPLHRINSSSAVIYAHEKTKNDFVISALNEIERMHKEIQNFSRELHGNN